MPATQTAIDMRFLAPVGGHISPHLAGVLTSPAHKGVPVAIVNGASWAADNEAFTGFAPERFFPWLEEMKPYLSSCLFVACPDSVGDYEATRRLWRQWYPHLHDWPVAYVGQDSETDIPTEASALFVGGSTAWKVGEQAADLIRLAQRRGLHVHIGRVNWGKRYRHFRLMAGSEDFTCDGTRTRYDGKEKAITAWINYQNQAPLFQLD